MSQIWYSRYGRMFNIYYRTVVLSTVLHPHVNVRPSVCPSRRRTQDARVYLMYTFRGRSPTRTYGGRSPPTRTYLPCYGGGRSPTC
jgi:hypothetical protein